MALLSDMISHLAVTTHLRSQPSGRNLADVPPLLYPYFRHTISSVRMSVVNTIALLTSLQSSAASSASPLADSRLFRLLLQNLILEHSPDILAASQTTFFTLIDLFAPQAGLICQLTQPDMQNWVTLVATPIGQPLSTAAMYRPTSSSGEVDAAALRQDMTLLDEDHVLRGRIAALSVLAEMLSYWPEEVLSQYIHATVVPALGSTSYFKSFCAASLISDCLKAFAARDCVAPTSATQPCAETIPPLLETTSSPVYDELAPHFRAISQDTDTLMKAQHKGGKAATKSKRETANEALSRALEQKDLAKLASKLDQLSKSEFCVSQEVNERATKIIVSTHRYRGKAESLDTRVSAARAGALVALGVIPPKLNPVIKGLMNSLKVLFFSFLRELLQSQTADSSSTDRDIVRASRTGWSSFGIFHCALQRSRRCRQSQSVGQNHQKSLFLSVPGHPGHAPLRQEQDFNSTDLGPRRRTRGRRRIRINPSHSKGQDRGFDSSRS